ncbi:MAG: hypothetical protein DWI00_16625 [Planctomycetota bacterium]|nr:MAG: hypothetical protein DWI00_16625 [Planctomycetota bacterium]
MSGTVFLMTVACRNSEKNNSETWAATSEEFTEAEKSVIDDIAALVVERSSPSASSGALN